ncbi:hypothetical protein ASG25_10865 [Rhizobium sp. Leaf384]|uniref:hypothetical protein n=1 Tax=Rhizobium sp. Leaf384 TaxID=1736358 RepID=UPI0007147436|nr:hypothetical protein [Rhizobium sp. Leaf384]KQS79079.1 hypothetical protein ASG25_10865 [Rhizobium sp. Leaf384]
MTPTDIRDTAIPEPVAFRFKHEHLPGEWKYASHSPNIRPWHNTEPLYPASTIEALTAQLALKDAERESAIMAATEAERERCAKIADAAKEGRQRQEDDAMENGAKRAARDFQTMRFQAVEIAAAIRAGTKGASHD